MASNVNLFVSDITPTGNQVSVDQYEIQLTANWIDNSGNPHTRTETVMFPNILGQMTNQWLKEHLMELIAAAAKVHWGVDDE